MKKIFTFLCTLLLLTTVVVNAQITQTNTQFPNPGFECWTRHNCTTAYGTDTFPDNWHTFDEVKCETFLNVGCGAAKQTSHARLTGTSAYGGSGNSIQLVLHEALGIAWANGTMTSGRTRVGDINVTSYKNYNYSDLSETSAYGNGHFYWEFIGCPDSMSFYYKTNWTSTSNRPYIKTYLHKGAWYDHANDALNNNGSSSTTNLNVDNYVAGCTHEFATSTSWKRFAEKFVYGSSHPVNDDANYSTLDRPQYILASFSTNRTAGGHQTDRDILSLDELWCIYDKGLQTLAVNGDVNGNAATMRSYFNNQEFLTHEPSRTYDANGNPIFNNSGTATYTWPVCVNSDAIPTIAATPKSKLITGFQIQQAVYSSGASSATATITITHNDNSTFVYSIVFNIAPATPTITGVTSACDDDQVTLTANTPNAVWYRWGEQVGTGTTYNATFNGHQTTVYEYQCKALVNGCYSEAAQHSIAVEYVQAPTVGNPTQTNICGSGSTSISATGTNQLFYWLLDGNVVQSTSTAANSSSYTTTLNQPGTYNYYCYTKNSASSSCKSANVPVQTITVHPAVTTPTNIQNAPACFGQTVTLSAAPSTQERENN